ncbi:hypothetical protein [Chryseobacterium arachidis]|nr:hypothetical protein [Chryseobacterium arachidis]
MIKFEYPSDWKLTEKQGIDSYFAYLSKDDDTIFITYGMYNPKTYKNPIKNNLFKQITIDGREAVIETSQNIYGGFASIYIPKADSSEGVYIFNKKANSPEVLDIYRTIKLGKSIRKVPLKLNFNEFTNKNSPPGIVLYENNCLGCHSEFRYEIGPSLDQKFIQSKGKSWLESYMYSKKQPVEYDIECSQIQKKDSSSVNEILKYLFQK